MAPISPDPTYELFVNILAVLISVIPAYYALRLYQRDNVQKVWLVFAVALLLSTMRRTFTLLDFVTPSSVFNGLDPATDTSIAIFSISLMGWCFWTLIRRYTIVRKDGKTSKTAKKKTSRGQGATEYIVLLAIVLMVALVVVGLLGFFPSFSSGTQGKESSSFWQTQSPIAITDAVQVSTGTTAATITLVVQNNAPNPITITNTNLTGATSTAITEQNTTFISIGAGGNSIITIYNATGSGNTNLDSYCSGNSGKATNYNVILTYNTGSLTGKKETGAKPLVVNCQ